MAQPRQPIDAFSGEYTRKHELRMVDEIYDQIEDYLDRRRVRWAAERGTHWAPDRSSPTAFRVSVEEHREHFRRLIGLVDERDSGVMERFGRGEDSPVVAATATLRIEQVRWPVVEGIRAQGLLLTPVASPVGFIVALPDADQSPEQIAGLEPIEGGTAFGLRLAESGFQVLVPLLVDRGTSLTERVGVIPHQPWNTVERRSYPAGANHREWIYRQSYVQGRHLIGYEVQAVLAAIDDHRRRRPDGPVGVAGYGEGGLIAFYAAAVDPRIDAALVSGYFGPREDLWQERVERNVWSLLERFGDAEIAAMIAPGGLVIEFSPVPKVEGPLPGSGARPHGEGRLRTPAWTDVLTEIGRLETLTGGDPRLARVAVISDAGKTVPFGSEKSLEALLAMLGNRVAPVGSPLADTRRQHDRDRRMSHHVGQYVDRLQARVHATDYERYRLIRGDLTSARAWERSMESYRELFYDELIGRLPAEDRAVAPNVRIRRVFDYKQWEGHEVIMDILPGVWGWGLLALPKDLRPGERRPVVIVQHGVSGSPTTPIRVPGYNHILPKLIERGFIVYSSFAPYQINSRKAAPVKTSVYSFIIPQYQKMVGWLQARPEVDPERIGFYGKSYGGRTALYVPPFVPEIKVVVCSAFFNWWPRKVINVDWANSFMPGSQLGVYDFNQLNTFSHAEMVYLIAPRPILIENGYGDPVMPAEWAGYEFAKVKRIYDLLGVGSRAVFGTHIGGHEMHDDVTFPFLHEHLQWPVPLVDYFSPLRTRDQWIGDEVGPALP